MGKNILNTKAKMTKNKNYKTQTMESIYKNLGGDIIMPEFRERKLYMHKTKMNEIVLPDSFKDYESAIETVLSKVKDRNSVCYITIDEKRIKCDTHRRSGVHVDYNWFENINAHNGGGGGGGTHKAVITPSPNTGGHNSGRSGSHSDGIPIKKEEKKSNGNHNGSPPSTHSSLQEFNKHGGMLLVSNYQGCKVWKGKFDGEIGEGGCCKNIDISNLQSEIMQPGEVYYLNALGIHESIVIDKEVNRSLIRINFHPEYHFD